MYIARTFAAAILICGTAPAQLSTGAAEGTLRDTDGRVAGGVPITVTGSLGFHSSVRTQPDGALTLTLPYGPIQALVRGLRQPREPAPACSNAILMARRFA